MMLFCNNVINFEGKAVVLLMNLAIFTAPAGPPPN